LSTKNSMSDCRKLSSEVLTSTRDRRVIACAYTSARSIGFYVIWVCISSSSGVLVWASRLARKRTSQQARRGHLVEVWKMAFTIYNIKLIVNGGMAYLTFISIFIHTGPEGPE